MVTVATETETARRRSSHRAHFVYRAKWPAQVIREELAVCPAAHAEEVASLTAVLQMRARPGGPDGFPKRFRIANPADGMDKRQLARGGF